MGLCKTSSFSIFTFSNASDLKFCPRSYSSCAYHMMRFKGSNGKVCKMMTSHFRWTFLMEAKADIVTIRLTPQVTCTLSTLPRAWLDSSLRVAVRTVSTQTRPSWLVWTCDSPQHLVQPQYCWRVCSLHHKPLEKNRMTQETQESAFHNIT